MNRPRPVRCCPGLLPAGSLAALSLLLVLGAVGCDPGAARDSGGEPGATDASPPPAPDAAAEAADAPPAEPRMAPDFTLSDLDGEIVRSADLRGKTVVIDFWATWCPPCEFQVPELNSFAQTHAGEGDVVVLGISVDLESDEVVREWAEKKGVEYRVLVGGEELARRFGALGFPTLFVLAPDGRIAMEHVGLIELADLETALAALRAGG